MKQVISGAQTGADLGGLEAAEKLGILTGGMVPKGCKNEFGDCPELINRFNLTESNTTNYVARTYDNAKNSDGTIRFAFDFESKGELCTLAAIQKYNKPWIDVDVENPIPVKQVVDWVKENKIEILNVAGNRESVYPGLKEFVVKYLIEVFDLLEKSDDTLGDSERS
jgi:hypothetical protein